MKVFVVHRSGMRREARNFLSSVRNFHKISIDPIFLNKSYGENWKKLAEIKIFSAEFVLVFDVNACAESENAQWEIEWAKNIGKSVVELSRDDISAKKIEKLQSEYDFESEFEDCFTSPHAKLDQVFEIYKIMVNSSEELIKRRQVTNGFFITVIGAIIGICALAIKEKFVTDGHEFLLFFPISIGLLMCRSWRNLIENYGKLNAGKFRVIHKIEEKMPCQAFEAEWIALGKGVRKEKYQSFTKTEQNVPLYFSYLLFCFMIFILYRTYNSADIGNFLMNLFSFELCML